jgi:hypothetical protein
MGSRAVRRLQDALQAFGGCVLGSAEAERAFLGARWYRERPFYVDFSGAGSGALAQARRYQDAGQRLSSTLAIWAAFGGRVSVCMGEVAKRRR